VAAPAVLAVRVTHGLTVLFMQAVVVAEMKMS